MTVPAVMDVLVVTLQVPFGTGALHDWAATA